MDESNRADIDLKPIAEKMLHYANQEGIYHRTSAISELEAVPIEELEELAEQWDQGEAPDQACASELRRVIERYD